MQATQPEYQLIFIHPRPPQFIQQCRPAVNGGVAAEAVARHTNASPSLPSAEPSERASSSSYGGPPVQINNSTCVTGTVGQGTGRSRLTDSKLSGVTLDTSISKIERTKDRGKVQTVHSFPILKPTAWMLNVLGLGDYETVTRRV